MSVENQMVLITGATSGIGYVLAKVFAENGFNLFIIARNENELQQTSEELKQQFNAGVETIAAGLFKRENAFKIYEQL